MHIFKHALLHAHTGILIGETFQAFVFKARMTIAITIYSLVNSGLVSNNDT